MSSLFPVFDIEDDETKKPSNTWLTIGSSYDESGKRKKETKTENNQDVSKEDKTFFNLAQRKTATDLISMDDSDDSDDSDAQKKKLRKRKRKHKKKKNYNPDIDDVEKMIEAGDDEKDYELELYENKATPLNHETEFLYKHKMKDGVCEVSILRFGEKDLYTYGFPQVKDVPAFRRIRHNLILGLKSDKSTLSLIDELNKIQGVNQSIYTNVDASVPLRRYFNTKYQTDEFVDIKKKKKFDPSVLQMDFLSFEAPAGTNEDGVNEEFKLNRDEMSGKEADMMDKAREYGKRTMETPNDPLLWIDYVNFQDKFHQGLLAKHSHSLVERKLSILDSAMSKNHQLENHPLMILFRLKLLDQSNKNDDFYKVLYKEWKDHLDRNNTNVVFWILFTDFKFSNFTKFSITYVRESFKESLEQIDLKIKGAKNTKEITIFKHLQLYLIRKLCYFEKMAGFSERATGILQSLAELNIFVPANLQREHNKIIKLELFKGYHERYELPRTGDLTNCTGWPDCETNIAAVQEEFAKDFIGVFEKVTLVTFSRPQAINKFIEDIVDYIPEDLEGSNIRPLLGWMVGEFDSLNYWRPANSEFDKQRVAESADSIVLFEDIENYLETVYQESFKMEILDMLFELLDLPPIFSGVFLKTYHTTVNWIYSTMLQSGLEKVFLETNTENQKGYQLTGVETHELFLRYPRIASMASVTQKQPLYISRIEYARRLLYHLNKIVPDCNNILSYIFYIESLYLELSQTFNTDEVTKSGKRIENLLKGYQKNYYLYIMYTEHVVRRSGKIDKAKKVFENLLAFATKKKDVFIIYYFYINLYVQKDLSNMSKDNQSEILKLLWRFTCYLQEIKYIESEITTMQIMKIHKTITSKMSEALLKTPVKSKRVQLYSMIKVCPLTKSSILLYFWFISANLFINQEIESVIDEFHKNMGVLQTQVEKKLKSVELERVDFIKRNNKNLQDLLNFAAYRLLIYKKHSANYVNPQTLKRFAIESVRASPKNVTLAVEAVKAIYLTSLRTNQLFKLKSNLELKTIETPYWYIIISEELKRTNIEEKEKFVNIMKNYFQEFTKEETLYDQLFFEIEKKYKKNKEQPSWDDYSYLQENYLYINDQFGKLYLKFIQLFFPQDLKREALILLHRLPFSKDKHLSHLIPCLDDDVEIKKNFTMIFEKELRVYKEYNV